MVVGERFYDQDTTLFIHRILQLPDAINEHPTNTSSLPEIDKLKPLDNSGGFVLQVSLEVVDGNNLELKEKAIAQLMAMKEILKQSVNIIPGDRLALDTRVPVTSR